MAQKKTEGKQGIEEKNVPNSNPSEFSKSPHLERFNLKKDRLKIQVCCTTSILTLKSEYS